MYVLCSYALKHNVGMDTAYGSPGKGIHIGKYRSRPGLTEWSQCHPWLLKELTARLEIPTSPIHPYSFSTSLSPSSSLLSAPFTSLFRRV